MNARHLLLSFGPYVYAQGSLSVPSGKYQSAIKNENLESTDHRYRQRVPVYRSGGMEEGPRSIMVLRFAAVPGSSLGGQRCSGRRFALTRNGAWGEYPCSRCTFCKTLAQSVRSVPNVDAKNHSLVTTDFHPCRNLLRNKADSISNRRCHRLFRRRRFILYPRGLPYRGHTRGGQINPPALP